MIRLLHSKCTSQIQLHEEIISDYSKDTIRGKEVAQTGTSGLDLAQRTGCPKSVLKVKTSHARQVWDVHCPAYDRDILKSYTEHISPLVYLNFYS